MDVQELLRNGVDVWTTVNVQHIESLNDLVSSITGVAVNEEFLMLFLTVRHKWKLLTLNRRTCSPVSGREKFTVKSRRRRP